MFRSQNVGNRKVNQVRMRCVQSGDLTRNGNLEQGNGGDADQDMLGKLSSAVSKINDYQEELSKAVQRTQYYQIATVVLIVLMAAVLGFVLRNDIRQVALSNSYCSAPPPLPKQ